MIAHLFTGWQQWPRAHDRFAALVWKCNTVLFNFRFLEFNAVFFFRIPEQCSSA